ncbi:MAG: sigma-70 family RNA polymerase sigma factor [Planctomycetota bacterium]
MSVSSDSSLTDNPPPAAAVGRSGRKQLGTPPPRIAPTDGELLSLFTRQQDNDALDRLIDRHAAMVWRVCRQSLRRQQDAEDAFQATFLMLVKSARQVRSSDSAAGWLYRVAYRNAIRARKKLAARREESLSLDPLAPSEAAFPDLLRKQTAGVLLEELGKLPERYQTPLVMRYLEGQSRRAIADQTDTTIAAVQGQLARGKQMLRRRLLRRGVSLSVAMTALSGQSQTNAAVPTNVVAQTTSNATVVATGGSLAASAAVITLYREGARAMFYGSLAKPLTITTSVAAVALLSLAPGASGEKPAANTPELTANVSEVTADEGDEVFVQLGASAERQNGDRPEPPPVPPTPVAPGVLNEVLNTGTWVEVTEFPVPRLVNSNGDPVEERLPDDGEPAGNSIRAMRRPISSGQLAGPHAVANQKVLDVLAQPLPEEGFNYDQVPLQQVIDHIGRAYGIDTLVKKWPLDARGIGPDEPVSAKFRHVPLGAALDFMLSPLDLRAVAENGVLTVTTAEEADNHLEARIYAAADLTTAEGREPGSLCDTVTSMIAPETWATNGGNADISILPDGRLAILQSQRRHEEVSAFLDALRNVSADQRDGDVESPAPNVAANNTSTIRTEVFSETKVVAPPVPPAVVQPPPVPAPPAVPKVPLGEAEAKLSEIEAELAKLVAVARRAAEARRVESGIDSTAGAGPGPGFNGPFGGGYGMPHAGPIVKALAEVGQQSKSEVDRLSGKAQEMLQQWLREQLQAERLAEADDFPEQVRSLQKEVASLQKRLGMIHNVAAAASLSLLQPDVAEFRFGFQAADYDLADLYEKPLVGKVSEFGQRGPRGGFGSRRSRRPATQPEPPKKPEPPSKPKPPEFGLPDESVYLIQLRATETYREAPGDVPATFESRLLERVREHRMEAERSKEPVRIIVGRVAVDKADDPRKVSAQMKILAQGYFLDVVTKPTEPIGFRIHGYQPGDIVVGSGATLVNDLGEVRLTKTPANEQRTLTGKVTLADGADPSQAKVTLRVSHGPFNNYSNGYEPRDSYANRVTMKVDSSGEWRAEGLSPLAYRVYFEADDHLRQWQEVDLAAGKEQTVSVDPVTLEKPRTVTIEYVSVPYEREGKGWSWSPSPPDELIELAKTAAKTTRLKAGDHFRSDAERCKYGWDFEIEQKDGQLGFRCGYAPVSMIDLGPRELADVGNYGSLRNPPHGDMSSNPPELIDGHVYLLDQQAWAHHVLFRVSTEAGAKPDARAEARSNVTNEAPKVTALRGETAELRMDLPGGRRVVATARPKEQGAKTQLAVTVESTETVETEVLRRGSSGPAVERLQVWLNDLLRDPEIDKLNIDGDFGPLTEQALRRWQQVIEAPVTGEMSVAASDALHRARQSQEDRLASRPGAKLWQGRWRVFHEPSDMNPDGWSVVAELLPGQHAPILLRGDQRPRPHFKYVGRATIGQREPIGHLFEVIDPGHEEHGLQFYNGVPVRVRGTEFYGPIIDHDEGTGAVLMAVRDLRGGDRRDLSAPLASEEVARRLLNEGDEAPGRRSDQTIDDTNPAAASNGGRGNQSAETSETSLNRAKAERETRPGDVSPDSAEARTASINRLRKLGIAFLTYEDEHGHLPSSTVPIDSSVPLLSWRVAMLPYLGEQALYDRFRHNEPWDSPHNSKLVSRMPEAYRNPRSRQPQDLGKTNYLAVAGPNAFLEMRRERRLAEIVTGTSNTIAVVEVQDGRSVEWTRPVDYFRLSDSGDPRTDIGSLGQDGAFLALFADGSVRNIDSSTPAERLTYLLQVSDQWEAEQSSGGGAAVKWDPYNSQRPLRAAPPAENRNSADSPMKQGRWRVFHEPSEMNPHGWAVVAELRVGEHVPVPLPGDERPRPHLKREGGEDRDRRVRVVDPGHEEHGTTYPISSWAGKERVIVRGTPLRVNTLSQGPTKDTLLVLIVEEGDRTPDEIAEALPNHRVARRLLRERPQSEDKPSEPPESSADSLAEINKLLDEAQTELNKIEWLSQQIDAIFDASERRFYPGVETHALRELAKKSRVRIDSLLSSVTQKTAKAIQDVAEAEAGKAELSDEALVESIWSHSGPLLDRSRTISKRATKLFAEMEAPAIIADQYGPASKMKQGRWRVFHEPSELDPDGWSVVGELLVGEHIPILLPGDKRPRPHLKYLGRAPMPGEEDGKAFRFQVVDPWNADHGDEFLAGPRTVVRDVAFYAPVIGGDKSNDTVLVQINGEQGREIDEFSARITLNPEVARELLENGDDKPNRRVDHTVPSKRPSKSRRRESMGDTPEGRLRNTVLDLLSHIPGVKVQVDLRVDTFHGATEADASVAVPMAYVEAVHRQQSKNNSEPDSKTLEATRDEIKHQVESIVQPMLPKLPLGGDEYKQVRVTFFSELSSRQGGGDTPGFRGSPRESKLGSAHSEASPTRATLAPDDKTDAISVRAAIESVSTVGHSTRYTATFKNISDTAVEDLRVEVLHDEHLHLRAANNGFTKIASGVSRDVDRLEPGEAITMSGDFVPLTATEPDNPARITAYAIVGDAWQSKTSGITIRAAKKEAETTEVSSLMPAADADALARDRPDVEITPYVESKFSKKPGPAVVRVSQQVPTDQARQYEQLALSQNLGVAVSRANTYQLKRQALVEEMRAVASDEDEMVRLAKQLVLADNWARVETRAAKALNDRVENRSGLGEPSYDAIGDVYGHRVEALQAAINERLAPSPQLTSDGEHGKATAVAVARFQRSIGVPATGYADRATREALGLADGPIEKPVRGRGELLQVDEGLLGLINRLHRLRHTVEIELRKKVHAGWTDEGLDESAEFAQYRLAQLQARLRADQRGAGEPRL